MRWTTSVLVDRNVGVCSVVGGASGVVFDTVVGGDVVTGAVVTGGVGGSVTRGTVMSGTVTPGTGMRGTVVVAAVDVGGGLAKSGASVVDGAEVSGALVVVTAGSVVVRRRRVTTGDALPAVTGVSDWSISESSASETSFSREGASWLNTSLSPDEAELVELKPGSLGRMSGSAAISAVRALASIVRMKLVVVCDTPIAMIQRGTTAAIAMAH
jgi:hypothetical protein